MWNTVLRVHFWNWLSWPTLCYSVNGHSNGASVNIHIIKLLRKSSYFIYKALLLSHSCLFVKDRMSSRHNVFKTDHTSCIQFLAGKTDRRSGHQHMLFSHTGVLIFNDCDHFKLHKDKYNYILAQSVCQMEIWCVQTLCGIQRWCTWEFNVTLTDGSALASSRIYLEVQHTCTHTLKHFMSCKNVKKLKYREKLQKITTQ